MSENSSLERINAAVRECLNRCYDSSDPFECWSQYIESLRADMTWNRHDVEQVQLATRRILKALLLPESHDSSDHLADSPSEWVDQAQGAV